MTALPAGVDGFPIGRRTASAAKLAARNAKQAQAAWLAQVPEDPRELADALRKAGVDLPSLMEALR